MEKVTYETIKNNEEINTYIELGNEVLGVLGYTDHSKVHAIKVAEVAGKILTDLKYSSKEIELAKIAGFMHDIGNSVNRNNHAHHGAIMAFSILKELGMDPKDIAMVISAIGNHDESSGSSVTPIAAAIILADKTDVRRNRVRNRDIANFDIHDRVNYSVISSQLKVESEKEIVHLEISLDESTCSVLDYFEIFLERMLMCRRAAELLKIKFKFTANGSKVI